MDKLINWRDFDKTLKKKNLLLFSATSLCRLFGTKKAAALLLLHRYSKRGFIVRLKRDLYTFPDSPPPDCYIANELVSPSYVSREFALSYHRVIPDTVYEMTSVTTKATRRFETLGKIYSYRRIKKDAFTGYRIEKQNGFSTLVADPEKAFVDANYFRIFDGLEPISRFDPEKVNRKKALHYSRLFRNQRLIEWIQEVLR